MRKPTKHTATDGTITYKIRFRSDGRETSRTFYRLPDAETFAAILGNGTPDRVAEALRWLATKESDDAAVTFGEFFATTFLRSRTGVTARTRADYEAMHRRYLSKLDRTPLPLVTRMHVADLVNDLEHRGLSAKTAKNAIHMLSAAFNVAVDEGLIDRNPCRRVRLYKDQGVRHQARFLTPVEFAALIEALPEAHRPLVIFLTGTGLRWSEATALAARHIDLDAGTVRVERAWKRVPGGAVLGAPKSEKSRRTVNAATMALVAIVPLLGKPDELVFRSPSGGPIHHGVFYNRVWRPAVERAGLADDPRPRPHDLRHTHASWLLSDGKQIEAVQDQLGHESSETTRRVYGHLLPAVGVDVGRSASESMRRALAGVPSLGALADPQPGALGGVAGSRDAGVQAHEGTESLEVAPDLVDAADDAGEEPADS